METHHTTLGAKANQLMMNEVEKERGGESDRDREKQSLDRHCDK